MKEEYKALLPVILSERSESKDLTYLGPSTPPAKSRAPLRMTIMEAIKIYRNFISPFFGSHCRFSPTCSAYAEEALKKKSIGRAVALITKRLLKCHPFHPGGLDPLV